MPEAPLIKYQMSVPNKRLNPPEVHGLRDTLRRFMNVYYGGRHFPISQKNSELTFSLPDDEKLAQAVAAIPGYFAKFTIYNKYQFSIVPSPGKPAA